MRRAVEMLLCAGLGLAASLVFHNVGRARAQQVGRAKALKQAARAAENAKAAKGIDAGQSAQAATKEESVAPSEVDYSPIGDEADRAALKMLDKNVTFDFEEVPFADVIEYFDQQSEARFLIDPLSRASIESSRQLIETYDLVTFDVEDVMLRQALTRILVPLELAWIAQDGLIAILPKADVEERHTTRVYPVPDLIFAKSGAEVTSYEDEFIEMLQNTIEPDSWEEDGGEATVEFLSAALSLSIRATQRNHGLIEELFTDAREARARSMRIADAKGLPSTEELIAAYHGLGRSGEGILIEEVVPFPVGAEPKAPAPSEDEAVVIARDAKRIAQKALDAALRVEQRLEKLEADDDDEDDDEKKE